MLVSATRPNVECYADHFGDVCLINSPPNAWVTKLTKGMADDRGGKDDGAEGLEDNWGKLSYLYVVSHVMGRAERGGEENEEKRRGVESCYSALFFLVIKTKR